VSGLRWRAGGRCAVHDSAGLGLLETDLEVEVEVLTQ
jgi:hypothetical protein